MELIQLEYFIAVCEARSFTKASELLHVSQPGVTKAVRKLEDELGVMLIDRSVKPVGLTEAGEFYYEKISRIVNELRSINREVFRINAGANEIVIIGIAPWSGVLLKELLLSEQSAGTLKLIFNIVERGNPEVFDMVLSGEVDLGWVMDIDRPREINFVPVETQEAYCLLWKEHPLAKKDKLSFNDIKNEGLSFGSTDKVSLISLVEKRCGEAGFKPHFAINNRRHPDFNIVSGWIRSGLGISFMPEDMARRMEDVVMLPMDPPLTYDIGIGWKSDSKLTSAQKQMINFIIEHYNANRTGNGI